MERASLIYEFNNSSPLFVRVAYEELEKKRPEKAIEIIESNLSKYSNYPTAFIVLGLAKAHLKEFLEAENLITKGCEIIDCEDTLSFYLAEIDKIKASFTQFPQGKNISFEMPEISEIKAEEIAPEEKKKKRMRHGIALEQGKKSKPIAVITENKNVDSQNAVDDFIAQLKKEKKAETSKEEADKIEKLKNDLYENPSIASETLAGIYFAQKSYHEAILVYEKLIEVRPDKTAFYNEKIDEIRKTLNI